MKVVRRTNELDGELVEPAKNLSVKLLSERKRVLPGLDRVLELDPDVARLSHWARWGQKKDAPITHLEPFR